MVSINTQKCIGCGACAALAPNFFELSKDGKAQVKASHKLDDDCKLAIENCPVNAIRP